MATRKTEKIAWSAPTVQAWLRPRLRQPVGIVLGSPAEVADLVATLGVAATCLQIDLYQADRLRAELGERGVSAQVVTAADLWDLSPPLQTLLYPAAPGGERSLKLDMIEQAFHALAPQGTLLVLTPYDKDQLFPVALKKVFRRVQTPAVGEGMILQCQKQGERPRRRHEVLFHVSREDGPSFRFVSRPGVFSYGRFDDGARALVETMDIHPGDRVLDVGCGCGTNGIIAGSRSGADGFTVFVDSNVRAVALAEMNARANGLTNFQALASHDLTGLPEGGFDVILANPPYYAYSSIAQLFIHRARDLCRPKGRFYLVTRQPDQVGPLVAEAFGPTEVQQRRGYTILCAGGES